MYKYFNLVLPYALFSSLLFSEDLIVVQNTIEELYEKESYEKACLLNDELYHKHHDNFKANLYYGLCAVQEGDTDKAMAAFDRAEMLDEENFLLHKYLGDLYVKIGNFEIANDEYDKADRFGNAPISRAAISEHDSHRLSFLLRINAGFDSNVNYSADGADMDLWFNGDSGFDNPETVSFAKEYLRITDVYDADPFSSFYLKSQLHAYNKNYERYHDEDLNLVQVYSGPGWATNTFDIWLPLSYTYIATGYDSYADIYSFEPQVRKRFDNGLLLKLEAKYEDQSYRQWDDGDKLIYSGGASLSRWFEDNYFRVGYYYLKADKDDGSSPRVFIDRYYNEIEVNYVRSISQVIEVGLTFLFRETSYEDPARLTLPSDREDRLRQYSGYISYDLNDYTGLVLQYDYYDNVSNFIPSDYTKRVMSAGVYFYF